jgi:hypothetical protein
MLIIKAKLLIKGKVILVGLMLICPKCPSQKQ